VVACAGQVTNKGNHRTAVGLSSWADHTYAIDNLGNQSDRTWLAFGAKGPVRGSELEQELEPEVPMNFAVTLRGISNDATAITLFLSNARRTEKLVFRNIPLQN
jgi:hypothetical protein